MRAIALLGKNLAWSAAAVAVCTVAAWLIGGLIASAAEPEAAEYTWRGGSIETRKLDHYYALRNSIIVFGAWSGLAAAQSTFLVVHLAPTRGNDQPMTDPVLLLEVDNLEICYGVISALQGVSLEIEEREIVALIGSNGAGKSTLLRAISGLLKPRRGSVAMNGEQITRLAPHEIVRRGISHVPEGRQIFANLTVRENLELGAFQVRSHDELRKRAERCYSLFPVLAERREQRGGTLSGGEQQMLAIARALMANPKLLLLDEPSLGLAPLVVRKIFQIIREINAAGTTVFLVEQNAHMALTIAHRAYVLQTGRVIKSDVASKLLEDPDVKKAYLGG